MMLVCYRLDEASGVVIIAALSSPERRPWPMWKVHFGPRSSVLKGLGWGPGIKTKESDK